MTPQESSKALTDEQIIERLATEVMGWENDGGHDFKNPEYGRWKCEKCGCSVRSRDFPKYTNMDQSKCEGWTKESAWNPLISWDAWRQVEEKVMKDDELFGLYIARIIAIDWQKNSKNVVIITGRRAGETFRRMMTIMQADLPTRCRALLSALDSLKQS